MIKKLVKIEINDDPTRLDCNLECQYYVVEEGKCKLFKRDLELIKGSYRQGLLFTNKDRLHLRCAECLKFGT